MIRHLVTKRLRNICVTIMKRETRNNKSKDSVEVLITIIFIPEIILTNMPHRPVQSAAAHAVSRYPA